MTVKYRLGVLLAALAFALSVFAIGVIQPARGASEDGTKPDSSQDEPAPEPETGNKDVERETVRGPDGEPVQAGSLLVNYKDGVSEKQQNANARGLKGKVVSRVKG